MQYKSPETKHCYEDLVTHIFNGIDISKSKSPSQKEQRLSENEEEYYRQLELCLKHFKEWNCDPM